MSGHVFISYGREDLASAKRVFAELKQSGLNPWLDVEVLQPGDRWKSAIIHAIRSSDFVIILLSRASAGRPGFVNREIREALDVVAEMPNDQPFLIPARLDECSSSHTGLSEFQRVDLFVDWDEGMHRIINVIETSRGPKGMKPVEPPKLAAFALLSLDLGAGTLDVTRAISTVSPEAKVFVMFGEHDLLVELSARDATSVAPYVEALRKIPGVRKAVISVGAGARL